MESNTDNICLAIRERLPDSLCSALQRAVEKTGSPLYLSGGTIRDGFLQRRPCDMDFFVPGSSRAFARSLISELGGGSFIDLSVPEEEAARVVWKKYQFDVSSPRYGAVTVEEDLLLRDYSINAMALEVSGDLTRVVRFIDPAGGLDDLHKGLLRHLPNAFTADPLRMLRGYRFVSTLGFRIGDETEKSIRKYAHLITNVAAERINYELQYIFGAPGTVDVIRQMVDTGLLQYLLPELFRGEGVEQPEFHHLDVMGHGICALSKIEKILARPNYFFPGCEELFREYLADGETSIVLKWAALLHDIGKPDTKGIREEDGRVTFHRHDETGVDMFQNIAHRLRWSKSMRIRVAGLIGAHMHPFHLCNVQRQNEISKRAALKLHRRVGQEMPGLFMLAMADSLASEGEKKPPEMENELQELWSRVNAIYNQDIRPVVCGPRLLTGRDIVEEFGLEPGPIIGEILGELEASRVELGIHDKQSALAWISGYLKDR